MLISFFIVSLILITLYFRSTWHNYIKDNLPAKLLRIRTFGKMKLEDFKDLISVADYKMCESKMEKNPTWYPFTLDVFIKFLYKVMYSLHYFLFPSSCFLHFFLTHYLFVIDKISNLADTAARLYRENPPEALRSAPDIWDTMTKAHDRLIKNIHSRNFEKFISVAHKDNNEDFFHEVPPFAKFLSSFPFTSVFVF